MGFLGHIRFSCCGPKKSFKIDHQSWPLASKSFICLCYNAFLPNFRIFSRNNFYFAKNLVFGSFLCPDFKNRIEGAKLFWSRGLIEQKLDFGPGARLWGVVFRILEAIAALFLWCGNSLLDVVFRKSTYVIVDPGGSLTFVHIFPILTT